MAKRLTLVTGGAGFIGSHLVDHLIERGDRVLVVDDLSTGRTHNLATHEYNPDVELVRASVTDEAVIAPLVERSDRVFHLAAGVGVRLLADEPARMLDENLRGTANVLACCASDNTPVMIASSSEVYGKSVDLPQSENANIVMGPPEESRWSYAVSKAAGESLALAYHRSQGLPVVVARFFNTVGPRQRGRYGMVIPRFLAQAEVGEPIIVYADGSQTRCFCHVLDTVAATSALLDTTAAFGEVVNVGTEERVSINELAALVKDMTGSDSEIAHLPFEVAYRPGLADMQDRQPDLSKLYGLVGFKPARTLREILVDTIEYRRLQHDAD